MRIQRSLALLVLAASAAPAVVGQYQADGKAFKPIDGGRRLDAFDDRMDRYEAIGNFEAQYWKQRGEAWQQWAIDQGYAPSENSHRAHPEKFNADGTPKAEYASSSSSAAAAAPEQQQKQQEQAGAPGRFSFWDYLDSEYYAQKAAEWEQYAQERGFLPDLGGSETDGPTDVQKRQLDAFDDRMDRYDAVAGFEQAYWKAYADGWVRWAQDMGYAPSPESQRVAAAQAAKEAKAASRRLDAFDDRMDRYDAVAEFEQAYWKAYADGWVDWAQRMGYMPSADSERAKAAKEAKAADGQKQQEVEDGTRDVPRRQLEGQARQEADDGGAIDVPRRRGLDAFDERMGRYQAVGNFEADYWKRYGDGWVQWAARQGYMPAPQQQQQQQQQQPSTQGGQVRQLDALDDRAGQYEALGQNQADYWNKYGDSWAQWAVRQGYMPAPKAPEGNDQQQQQQPGRRLDAFDDRMDRYEAIGNFEAQYWKRRGEAWQQWAIDQGYAPSENSHRAHPEKFNADGTLKAASEPAPAAGGDKAETIPGDFYKTDGRSWAQWMADQAFGGFRRFDEEEAAAQGGAYPPMAGFAGREGTIADYIQEKLAAQRNKVQQQAAMIEGAGEIRPLAAVPTPEANKAAAQGAANPYQYSTFMGRSAARVANGLATAAGAVVPPMAGNPLADAAAAYEVVTAKDKQAAAPATPATPAAPGKAAPDAPKHKNMRGGKK